MRDQLRLAGAVRGAIITYGIAAYTYLVRWPSPEPPTPGLLGHTSLMLLAGLALQGSVFIVRSVAGRSVPGGEPEDPLSPQAAYLFELGADGVTVLLFALATYGRIAGFSAGF